MMLRWTVALHIAFCALALAAGPEGGVEFFLVHQADLYPGQESVGVSLKLGREPAGEAARVEILDLKGGRLLQHDLGPLKARLTRAAVPVADLKEGDYRAVCRVTDPAGQAVGQDSALLRVAALPQPKALDIPLRIGYPPRLTDGVFPVTVGVPFAWGTLPADGLERSLRLTDAKGAAVAFQARPAAFWPLRRYVQWAHLDFLAAVPLTGKEGWQGAPPTTEGLVTYTLRLDPGAAAAAAAAPTQPVKVSQSAAAWVLDNGLLRARLDPTRPNPLADISLSAKGDGDRLLAENAEAGFFLTDEKATAYRPAGETPWTVTVEKAGPVAAVVRMDAVLADQGGHEIGRLRLRLRQYAGLPRLTVSHTFIYTDLRDTAQITSMGLNLPLRPVQTVRVGMDEYAAANEAKLADGPVRFLQSSWCRATLEQGNPGVRRLLEFCHFAPGWMDLDTGDYHAVVMFPEGLFWKEYPKEFHVEPGGMTRIGLVPAVPDPALDLRTGRQHKGTDWQATGFAKTHEFSLEFYRGPRRDDKRLLEASYGAPRAWPDAAYACGTEAVGPLTPVDTGDVKAQDWASCARKFMWYGALDYGDAWNNQGPRLWYWRTTGINDFRDARYRLQHEQIGARWLANNWLAFLAGGNRLALEKCFAITRHLVDVDSIHALPRQTRAYDLDPDMIAAYLGGHHNHGGSQQHWSGKPLPAPYEATLHVSPMILCYNLTGWERAWDTVEEWRQGLLAHPEIPREKYTTRRCMGPIEAASWAYRQTWDPALLESARQHWNVALRFLTAGEASPIEAAGFWSNVEYVFKAAEPYYHLTRDERILEMMKTAPPRESRGIHGDLLAYRLTGDPEILKPYAPKRLQQVVDSAPRELVKALPPKEVKEAPFDWLSKTRVHSWVDVEDILYEPVLKDLALAAIKAGTLSNVPSRRTVVCVAHKDILGPRHAVAFIVRKDAGKPFEIGPISFNRNTQKRTYKAWNALGEMIASGEVPGLKVVPGHASEGRVTLAADLPAGLYRVRVAYEHGPPDQDRAAWGAYTEMTVTLPPASRWMIESHNTGGYPGPYALVGDETFVRFVVPEGAQAVEAFITRDMRVGRWFALVDPAGKAASVVENGEANWATVDKVWPGIRLATPKGFPVTPGVWEIGLEPRHALNVRFLQGALPYQTYAPDAVLTAQELSSLPKTWQNDGVE